MDPDGEVKSKSRNLQNLFLCSKSVPPLVLLRWSLNQRWKLNATLSPAVCRSSTSSSERGTCTLDIRLLSRLVPCIKSAWAEFIIA